MDIGWFRDLVICISGLVVTVVVIFVGVLAYMLYNGTRSVLNSLEATSENIRAISSTVKDNVVRPVAQLVAIVQGISQGIDLVSRFFKKEGGDRDG